MKRTPIGVRAHHSGWRAMGALRAKAACSVLLLGAIDNLPAQTPQPTAPAAQAPAATKPVPATVHTNLAKQVPARAHMYYQGVWGVDSLTVKYTESGEIIRFSYRVLDPEKAATLNDKKAEPSLSDPQAGVSLVVPKMENIGQLRQSSTPIAGKSYWMAFSNSGRLVKPGHRVNVQIDNSVSYTHLTLPTICSV